MRDDIIRMALDAGINKSTAEFYNEELGRMLAAERNRTWTQTHWTEYERSIVAGERERIACMLRAEGWLYCATMVEGRGE